MVHLIEQANCIGAHLFAAVLVFLAIPGIIYIGYDLYKNKDE